MSERQGQQSSLGSEDTVALADWNEILTRRVGSATSMVGSAAAAAAAVAVTAVTAVPMSLPLVGPIVKRIRQKAPDQRVINESPEESCTRSFQYRDVR